MRTPKTLLLLTALTASCAAVASTQGSIGGSSTGTAVISLTSPALVRASDFEDIALGSWSGTGDLQGGDDLCIWSNTGAYNVTASGSGTGGAFELQSDIGNSRVAYDVLWDDQPGAVAPTTLSAGTVLGSQQTAAAATDCNGGASPTASMQVRVPEAELQGMPGGQRTYTGVLTIMVAPE